MNERSFILMKIFLVQRFCDVMKSRFHLKSNFSKNVATLSDVAEKAGVSKQAVSAVLVGSQVGTRVSEKTRQRILEAVFRTAISPQRRGAFAPPPPDRHHRGLCRL